MAISFATVVMGIYAVNFCHAFHASDASDHNTISTQCNVDILATL